MDKERWDKVRNGVLRSALLCWAMLGPGELRSGRMRWGKAISRRIS